MIDRQTTGVRARAKVGWAAVFATMVLLLPGAAPALAMDAVNGPPVGPDTEDAQGDPFGLAVPALGEQLSVTIPVLQTPGDPAGGTLASATPWFIALDSSGDTAFTSDSWHTEIFVFDLPSRTHVKTLVPQSKELRSTNGVKTSTVGDRAFAAYTVSRAQEPDVLVVLDTAQRTIVREVQIPAGAAYRTTISPDGKYAFLGDNLGRIYRVDLEDPTNILQNSTKREKLGALAVSPDGSQLYVGSGADPASLEVLDTANLTTQRGPVVTPGQWQYTDISFAEGDPEHLYLTAFDSYITKMKLEDFSVVPIPVGSRMSGVIGDPAHNRAWGSSFGYALVQVADFTEGKRAIGFRSAAGGPSNLVQRPGNGEIVVPNGGTANTRGPDPSISLFLVPEMTDPEPVVEVSALGDVATFSVTTKGIKTDAAGGVFWQSSPDGETWTDVEPQVSGTTLDVTVTAASAQLQYRARYHDDFWSRSGASAAGRIVGPAPTITDEITNVAGETGEPIERQQFTAKAQAGHSWSASGLPEGLALDPVTGALTGTPTKPGSFAVTITVTDAFGSDSKQVTLVFTGDDPSGGGDEDDDDDEEETGGGTGGGTGSGGGSGGGSITQPTKPAEPAPGLPGTGAEQWVAIAFGTAITLLGAVLIGGTVFRTRRAVRSEHES